MPIVTLSGARRAGRVFAAASLFAFAATAAEAHAHLVSSTPAAGATVAAPAEVRLKFSEGVEPRFSSIAVAGPAGAAPLAAAVADPADPTALIAKPSAALAAGVYTVTWKAVSVDTHHSQGSFTFTVRP